MSRKLISIAVVTFNAASTIKKLLSTIRNQTYDNLQIVVIDGCSKDNTLEVVRPYLKEVDVLVSEPDKGVYDAMNKALKLASGDFLIFMGCDDYFYSNNAIEKVVDNINKTRNCESSVFYGDCFFEECNSIVRHKQTNWSWVRGTMCHQGIFYPKCVYKKYQYNLLYKINADYAYNLQLWSVYDFVHVDVVVSFFASSGLSSNSFDVAFRKDLPQMIKKNCGLLPYYYKLLRMFMGRLVKKRII